MKLFRRVAAGLLGLAALIFANPSDAYVVAGTQSVVVLAAAMLTSNGSLQVVNLNTAEVDLIVNVTGTVSGGGTLTFAVKGSDPLNPTTVVTGDCSATGTGIVATAAHQVVTCERLGSSAVTITWTITGGSSDSFAGVNATLAIKQALAQ